MSEKIKVGLLGCGGIAGAHAPGFKAAEDRCVVTAVAEPNTERHPWIRETFGDDVALYDDYRGLPADADVDAVDILLPHNLHMPAAIVAAEAGKHVLVEKVMARNVYECDRMIEACEKAGVTLTVCHDRRYAAEWIALKQVVDSGLLGEIWFWKLDHNQDVNPRGGHIPWAASKEGIGGGAIMSCLTHQIDALRWYGGEVATVTCLTRTVADRMDGELIGVIAAKMASGALAELSINWGTRQSAGGNGLWYEMVQVCGSTGEAYYMSGKGTFVRLHDGTDVREHFAIDGTAEDGFARLKTEPSWNHMHCISEWLNLLLGRKNTISTSGRDVRGTVEVAEAAYLSEQTGRVVELPIEPAPWGRR